MNSEQAVLLSGLVTVGSTVSSAVLPKEMGGRDIGVSPRLLIGTGLTFAALSFLESFAPAIATPLSLSIALTALMYYGIPVLEKVTTKE